MLTLYPQQETLSSVEFKTAFIYVCAYKDTAYKDTTRLKVEKIIAVLTVTAWSDEVLICVSLLGCRQVQLTVLTIT